MHLNAKSALRRLNRKRGQVLPSVNAKWKHDATKYAEEMAARLGITMVVQYPVLHPTNGFSYSTIERSPVVSLAA